MARVLTLLKTVWVICIFGILFFRTIGKTMLMSSLSKCLAYFGPHVKGICMPGIATSFLPSLAISLSLDTSELLKMTSSRFDCPASFTIILSSIQNFYTALLWETLEPQASCWQTQHEQLGLWWKSMVKKGQKGNMDKKHNKALKWHLVRYARNPKENHPSIFISMAFKNVKSLHLCLRNIIIRGLVLLITD